MRLAGLGIALALTAACGDGGPAGPTRSGGNGGTSTGGATAQIVGTWRTILVVEVPGDIQTWTTVWRFEADGTCHQTRETESLAEGFPRVTERSCTFATGDFEIVVTFTGGDTLEMEYAFADFSPDRLILDGFEYVRLA